MTQATIGECGPLIARAIGAPDCAECHGAGSALCGSGFATEGPCLWCGSDAAVPPASGRPQ